MLGWSVDSFPAGFTKAGDLDNALAATKWGADYLVAAHSAPNRFVAGAPAAAVTSCCYRLHVMPCCQGLIRPLGCHSIHWPSAV